MTPPTPSLVPPSRREWLLVLALTLLAAILRFQKFGGLGLSHFDEGIYALSGLWVVTPGGLFALDPQVIAYAPPGFPILIGLAYSLLGISDTPALLIAIIAGLFTIPAAAWLARQSFGPGAGAAAAAFSALSLAHIAFSRKALTDAPFLLTWILALSLGIRFLDRPRLGRALAFGIAVGIAQNFKYNGWLAGAIPLLAALAGLLSNPDARRPSSALRTFSLLALAAFVAALMYLPWFRFVENHGGYADLIRHHRGYLGGPNTWLPYWRAQLAQTIALSGGVFWGASAWIVAWLSAGFALNGSALILSRSRWDTSRLLVAYVLGASALAIIPDLAWWVGLAWSAWLIADTRPAPRIVGIWWLVLSVMTPFYHPYARLWLPLHAVGWIMLAGVVVKLGPFTSNLFSTFDRSVVTRPRVLLQAFVAILCLILALTHWPVRSPRPLPYAIIFAPTSLLRTAAAQLASSSPFPSDGSARLRVLARRPLAFYLAINRVVPFRLLPDNREILEGPGASGEWALVDEVQLGESLKDGPNWKTIFVEWNRTADWKVPLDAVTLLDVNPNAASDPCPLDQPQLVLLAPRPPIPPASRPSGSISKPDSSP